jgi:hypothetical protein
LQLLSIQDTEKATRPPCPWIQMEGYNLPASDEWKVKAAKLVGSMTELAL